MSQRRAGELLTWLARKPITALRRAAEVFFLQRRKYAQGAGYDAERYWRDRLARHGVSLKGPGREARSEAENAADYARAAETFEELCKEVGIQLLGAKVLDIGCGNGFYARLCQAAGVTQYRGIDITDTLFPHLTHEFPEFQFVKRDATEDVLNGSFDVVLMIDVVEHIVEETKLAFALQNVDRCVAPGGVFVVALPSAGHWPKRLFYVRRWRQIDIARRLPAYTVVAVRGFRDGRIFALRKALNQEQAVAE